MVNGRQDLGLLRLVRMEENQEKIPISYIRHFSGWFKLFDVQLSPFHCVRAVLYHWQDVDDFSWMIGIEAGHIQRVFITMREAEFFRDNLWPDSPDFSFASVGGHQLMIEKFSSGFLLQKYSYGMSTWCFYPYVCAGYFTFFIKNALSFIELFVEMYIPDGKTPPKHILKDNLIRVCTRRVLGYKIVKKKSH